MLLDVGCWVLGDAVAATVGITPRTSGYGTSGEFFFRFGRICVISRSYNCPTFNNEKKITGIEGALIHIRIYIYIYIYIYM